MKQRKILTGFPMIAVLSVIAGIWLGSLLAGCGSSGDGAVQPGATKNHLFNGTYHYYAMEQDESSSDPPVVSYTIIANSDGTASIPGLANLTYAVYSDRSMTLIPGGTYENLYGKISNTGDIFALTDTDYDVATTDVELGIGVRNSSGRVLSEMEGDYIVYQAGVKNPDQFYTARVGVTVNSAGVGNAIILAHSLGDTGNLPVTAIVNGDGTFVANNGIADDYGIISEDGNLFVMADADFGDGDNEMILALGIKNSLTEPDVLGEFLINQVGLSNSTPEEYTARVAVVMGVSDYSFSIKAHSLNHSGSLSSIPYFVYPDGTADIARTERAQATRDGRVLAFSGTDNIVDDELVFGLGIR